MIYSKILRAINEQFGSVHRFVKELGYSKNTEDSLLEGKPINYKYFCKIMKVLGMNDDLLDYSDFIQLLNERFGSVDEFLDKSNIDDKDKIKECLQRGRLLPSYLCKEISDTLNVSVESYFPASNYDLKPSSKPSSKRKFGYGIPDVMSNDKESFRKKYDYSKILEQIALTGKSLKEFLMQANIQSSRIDELINNLENGRFVSKTYLMKICRKVNLDYGKYYTKGDQFANRIVLSNNVLLTRDQVTKLFNMSRGEFENLSVYVLEIFGIKRSIIDKFCSRIYQTDIVTIGDYAKKARTQLYDNKRSKNNILDSLTAAKILEILAFYGIYVQSKAGQRIRYVIKDRKPYFENSLSRPSINIDVEYLLGLYLIKSREVSESTHPHILDPVKASQDEKLVISSYARSFMQARTYSGSHPTDEAAANGESSFVNVAKEVKPVHSEKLLEVPSEQFAEEKLEYDASDEHPITSEGDNAPSVVKPDKRHFFKNGWVTGARVRKHNMFANLSQDEMEEQQFNF